MIKDHLQTYIAVILFSITLVGISPLSFALDEPKQTITISSIFSKRNADNTRAFNGTIITLNGTKEQLINKYYELGEQFDKQTGIKQNENVTYVFKNGTNVTIPYSGYKNFASEDLFYDVLHPIGNPGDTICWRDDANFQIHYVCDPRTPPWLG